MDLIDRAALIDYLMLNMGWHDEDGREVDDSDEKREIIKDLVDGVPTVDAVPMRRTKPVIGVSRDNRFQWWSCCNCESVIEQGDRYCRGCGAEVEWDGGSK